MIDLLDAPLRVTWMLPDEEGNASVSRQIAERLSEAAVFYVTLLGRPLYSAELELLLSILDSGGCRSILVCDGHPEDLKNLKEHLPLDSLFIDTTFLISAGQPDLLRSAIDFVRTRGYEPGLLMTPLRSNLKHLPELLRLCKETGIDKLKLPNICVGSIPADKIGQEILTSSDICEFRNITAANSLPVDGIALEVHDLFLWEILCPSGEGGRSEYGGCQAANSVGHVDPRGYLYPCSSWPESLGSLLDDSLLDLWDSPRRYEVRKEIATVPEGCSKCREFALCFGGCRGLSKFFGKSEAGGRDILCQSPR